LQNEERDVLFMFYFMNSDYTISEMFEKLAPTKEKVFQLIGRFIGLKETEVAKIVKPSGLLAINGFIRTHDEITESPLDYPEINEHFLEALALSEPNIDGLLENLVGKTQKSELKTEDFEHIGTDVDYICE